MPPSNTSFATATQIPSLPYDFTQTDIYDAGTGLCYNVYYKFTAPAGAREIGAWGWSVVGSGYFAQIQPFDVTETRVLNIASDNVPIQFPVDEGQIYYLLFIKNGNTAAASLRVRVEVAPNTGSARGNILVNDDTNGFPSVILSNTQDYTTKLFVKGTASGEAGDTLDNADGTIALEDRNTNTIKIYDSFFNLIATTPAQTGTIRLRSCRGSGKFWVGLSKNPPEAKSMTAAGVFGTVFTLSGTNMLSLAAKDDETILYFSTGGINSPVKRWDLLLDAAMSDLAAGIANTEIPDILYLSDNTIIVLYYNTTTKDVSAKRYSTAGAVLNTYTIGNQTGAGSGTMPRAAYALDNPNSFWSWRHITGNISVFENIKCSDGSVLTTRQSQEYEGGGYQGPESATPTARFGNSYSCPFIILTAGSAKGMFKTVTDKRTDHDGTHTVAIPTPTFKTALLP